MKNLLGLIAILLVFPAYCQTTQPSQKYSSNIPQLILNLKSQIRELMIENSILKHEITKLQNIINNQQEIIKQLEQQLPKPSTQPTQIFIGMTLQDLKKLATNFDVVLISSSPIGQIYRTSISKSTDHKTTVTTYEVLIVDDKILSFDVISITSIK